MSYVSTSYSGIISEYYIVSKFIVCQVKVLTCIVLYICSLSVHVSVLLMSVSVLFLCLK